MALITKILILIIQIIYPTKYIIKFKILKANINNFVLENIFKSKLLIFKKPSYFQKHLQVGFNIIGMANVAVTRLNKSEKLYIKNKKLFIDGIISDNKIVHYFCQNQCINQYNIFKTHFFNLIYLLHILIFNIWYKYWCSTWSCSGVSKLRRMYVNKF